MIYFDHNATSPLSAVAKEAWLSAVEKFPANPSSPHRLGSRAETALSNVREAAAEFLGCSPFDLIWTSGATEGNNAIFHHASTMEGEAWITGVEHPSTMEAAHRWFRGRVRHLLVQRNGQIDLNHLEDLLKKSRPAIVSVMAANNEIGVLQPWSEALSLCREKGVLFASDAAQWVGKEPAYGLGACDFMTACGHKFGGPVGIGILKVPKQFRPYVVGGPQEEGRRAGTENIPGTMSMVAAWSERESQLSTQGVKKRLEWRDQFCLDLQAVLPWIEILGVEAPRLWNTVSVLMPPIEDCRRRWVVQLDRLGFAVSTGSACSSGKEKPSHVLTAMGYTEIHGDRMLRFSSGWETTDEDWRKLLSSIATAFSHVSRPSPPAVKSEWTKLA